VKPFRTLDLPECYEANHRQMSCTCRCCTLANWMCYELRIRRSWTMLNF